MKLNGHRRTIRLMTQPATGWYAECSCGGIPNEPLRLTRERAVLDFENHLKSAKKKG